MDKDIFTENLTTALTDDFELKEFLSRDIYTTEEWLKEVYTLSPKMYAFMISSRLAVYFQLDETLREFTALVYQALYDAHAEWQAWVQSTNDFSMEPATLEATVEMLAERAFPNG